MLTGTQSSPTVHVSGTPDRTNSSVWHVVSIKIRNEGGCRDGRSPKMMETRHGLESNPSIFGPRKAMSCSKTQNGCKDRVRL